MTRRVTRDEAILVVRHGPLVAPVLKRFVGMLAAQASPAMDRLHEVLLVVDTIAAHAPALAERQLTVAVRAAGGVLQLRIGPLRDPRARTLLLAARPGGGGTVLQHLVDEVTLEGEPRAEYLVLRLSLTGPVGRPAAPSAGDVGARHPDRLAP